MSMFILKKVMLNFFRPLTLMKIHTWTYEFRLRDPLVYGIFLTPSDILNCFMWINKTIN